MKQQLEIFFADKETEEQFEQIPQELQQELDEHFATLLACESMRKAPFPAHRNRGVSITVEIPEFTAIVHATRMDGEIAVLGIINRVRTKEQQQDYLAEKAVDCPFCGALMGEPCKATDGHPLTYVGTRKHKRRTHAARRELHQTGDVRYSSTIQKSIPFLTASGIRNELAESIDQDWAEVFDQFRNMYDTDEMGDGLIDGAMRVIEKHYPNHLWSPKKFWHLMCEQVSGPHENVQQLVLSTMARNLRVRIITQKQFDYYRTTGVMGYAAYVGMDFAPHPLGGFVAVRNLKEI